MAEHDGAGFQTQAEFFFHLGRLFEGIIQRLDGIAAAVAAPAVCDLSEVLASLQRIESTMSDLQAADAALAQAVTDALARIGTTNDQQTALIAQLQATVTADDATISGDTATIADLTAQIAALQGQVTAGIQAATDATAALNAVDVPPAPPADVPPAG